jgi:hypothetical protein
MRNGELRNHGQARELRHTATIRKADDFGQGRVKGSVWSMVVTPGAIAALDASGNDLSTFLARHQSGDWGEVDAEDVRENELSLEHGWRLLSAYTLKNGTKIWVITGADRSSTCLLLPK